MTNPNSAGTARFTRLRVDRGQFDELLESSDHPHHTIDDALAEFLGVVMANSGGLQALCASDDPQGWQQQRDELDTALPGLNDVVERLTPLEPGNSFVTVLVNKELVKHAAYLAGELGVQTDRVIYAAIEAQLAAATSSTTTQDTEGPNSGEQPQLHPAAA